MIMCEMLIFRGVWCMLVPRSVVASHQPPSWSSGGGERSLQFAGWPTKSCCKSWFLGLTHVPSNYLEAHHGWVGDPLRFVLVIFDLNGVPRETGLGVETWYNMQPQTGLQSTSSKTPAISSVLVKEGTLWQVDVKWMPDSHKRTRNTENLIGGVRHVVAMNYMKLPSFFFEEVWALVEHVWNSYTEEPWIETFAKSLSTAILIRNLYKKVTKSTFIWEWWWWFWKKRTLKPAKESLRWVFFLFAICFFFPWGFSRNIPPALRVTNLVVSPSSSKHRDVQRLRFLAEQVRKRRFFVVSFGDSKTKSFFRWCLVVVSVGWYWLVGMGWW